MAAILLHLLTFATLFSILTAKVLESQSGQKSELNKGQTIDRSKVSSWLQSAKENHRYAIEVSDKYNLPEEIKTKLNSSKRALDKVNPKGAESRLLRQLKRALSLEAKALRYMWEEYKNSKRQQSENPLLFATFYVVKAVGDLVMAIIEALSDPKQKADVSSATKDFQNRLLLTARGLQLPDMALQAAKLVLNKTAVLNNNTFSV